MTRKLIMLILAIAVLLPLSAFAQDNEWTQIHLLYNSDVGGKIEPCG
ncbi:hypothetical protein HN388_04355 [bacterium]|nr:hypothetical protein [bacterium]MBT4291056.1 hypothetical protein [bacterium]MBT7311847.1 hypothetical protein [bacterium]